jgi:hypothetical protein
MRAQITTRSRRKVEMKKLLALLFTVGVTLCTAGTANAQALKVSIPFDFVVNGKTLPASTYTVREALPNSQTSLFFLGDGARLATMATSIDDSATGSKLVFRRIGGDYLLSDVVTLNGTLHFALSRKQTEQAQGTEPQFLAISAD